ncbi:hypothetical protein Tco_0774197 [Tanacetum coccineum]|uniref:Uncharacterized protein n=1 Tax=Tanacetum coccineum TaxID=301880 RepID=A0ABQ4ZQE2_9ASTR
MLDTEKFTYTVDMFCDTLHLPVKTPENPFVAPINIQTIKDFMNMVGYQGMVDKVSAFYTKNLALPWQTMFKVFNRCLTTRTSGHDQTKINILQLFHAMINRTNVDYAALLWWDFMNNGKKRKQSVGESSSPLKSLKITIRQQKVVEGEKDDDDSEDRLELGGHKENPKHVVDDDNKEKVDEIKDDEIGSLETRTEEMHTPIPTTPRSPRKILSLDKNIVQELTDTILTPTATTSKDPHSKRRISSKYSHLLGAHRRMCRRQGYMIKNMERKCVTIDEIRKVHKKVDQVLHKIVPQNF